MNFVCRLSPSTLLPVSGAGQLTTEVLAADEIGEQRDAAADNTRLRQAHGLRRQRHRTSSSTVTSSNVARPPGLANDHVLFPDTGLVIGVAHFGDGARHDAEYPWLLRHISIPPLTPQIWPVM
jgi:hypothetical protein